MADPTYDYFGTAPVTVVMQATTAFDGTAYAPNASAALKPGLAIFPAAANCGLLDFHKRPLVVENIFCSSGLTVTVSIVYDTGVEVGVGTASDTAPLLQKIVLPVNAKMKFVGGPGKVSIVASEYITGNSL